MLSSRSRRAAVVRACYRALREGTRQRAHGRAIIAQVRIMYRCPKTIMETKPPYYHIYLLTVWQEWSRGPPAAITWRFRLEDPRTGRQQAFADAGKLMSVLHLIDADLDAGADLEANEE